MGIRDVRIVKLLRHNGTMWIVSTFIVLGLKGMWVHWLWGFPITAFYLAYMGKWIRRSDAMTGAEWMRTRFGSGKAGDMARLSYTLFASSDDHRTAWIRRDRDGQIRFDLLAIFAYGLLSIDTWRDRRLCCSRRFSRDRPRRDRSDDRPQHRRHRFCHHRFPTFRCSEILLTNTPWVGATSFRRGGRNRFKDS